MGILLTLAFLFFIGSVFGWCLEVVFRRFFSAANPERKWINPGFCMGPYLPLYGVGLCCLYLIASMSRFINTDSKITVSLILFPIMAVSMTVIEYIAGIMALKLFKVRLWDYSDEWGNIQGLICPKFSFFWTVLGAVYYFLIHPYILGALEWLSNNLTFSFAIGMFYGVFIIDLVNSSQIIAKLKKYADDNEVIIKYEYIKAHIRKIHEERKQKYHFFSPFRTERPLHEYLKEQKQLFEQKKKNIKLK